MDNRKPAYEVPQVTSYSDEEILEELGEISLFRPPPISGGNQPPGTTGNPIDEIAPFPPTYGSDE